MDLVTFGMRETSAFAQEMFNIYGKSNIGTLLTSSATDNGDSFTVKTTLATWAPGVFVQAEGAYFDFYPAAGGAKLNGNLPLRLTGVDPDTRLLTFEGNAADIDDVIAGADPVIVPLNANAEWGWGIHKILTTTSGNTLFNLSTNYPTWRATQKAVSGMVAVQTFSDISATKLIKGGGGPVKVYASPYTFTDLNNDSMELKRDVRAKGGDVEYGYNEIRIMGVGGEMTIVPHIMVMAGYAYGLTLGTWKRVGTTDHTWSPGEAGKVLFDLPFNAGKQLRCGWDCTPFCTEPAKNFVISGIVNRSLPA
jgi:hypothetical protein